MKDSAVVQADAAGGWSYSLRLPKYTDDGDEIAYEIEGGEVLGCTASITGDVLAGYTVTNTFTEKKLAETGSNGVDVALASLCLARAMALGLGRRKNA